MPPRRQFKPTNRGPGHDWVRIANTDSDAADIYILDEIGYWGTTAEGFVEQLNAITASQIRLHISSPGGSVFDGLTIHSAIRHHPSTVTSYVDGLAASAASFIALAGDRVVTARNAMWMIHDASTWVWGNPADLREEADVLDKASDNIADIYAQQAGGTVADWRDLMSAETWYTGVEAVANGLADDLLAGKRKRGGDQEPDEDMEDVSRWDLAARFRYAGRDVAPPPKAIRRERVAVKANAEANDGLLRFLRQQASNQAVTVTTTGAATVSLTYGPSAEAEPLVVDDPPAEPVAPSEPATDPPAAEPADDPAAEPPALAEPVVEPAVEAEAATEPEPAGEPDAPAPAGEPDAPETPAEADDAPEAAVDTPTTTDEWAHLVAHLTAAPSIEDELARLRETYT